MVLVIFIFLTYRWEGMPFMVIFLFDVCGLNENK